MTIRGIICVALDAFLLMLAFGSGNREIMIASLTLLIFWVFALLSVLLAGVTLRLFGQVDMAELDRKKTVRYRLLVRGFVLFPVTGHLTIMPPGFPPRSKGPREKHAFFLMPPMLNKPIYEFNLECPHQGNWHAGWEHIYLYDIFGLFSFPMSNRRRQKSSCSVMVFPLVYELLCASEQASSSNGNAVTMQKNAMSGELLSDTRQYQPGDSARRIHWKQTARAQEIYVRQFENQENIRNLILLDTGCFSDNIRDVADIATEIVTSLAKFELINNRHLHIQLIRNFNDGATSMGGDDFTLQDENDMDRLCRILPAVEFHFEDDPLYIWQLRDAEFIGADAVRVITDNPSGELLTTLSELQAHGHQVACYVPDVEGGDPEIIENSMGNNLPLYIKSPKDIPEKVGGSL